MALKSSQDIHLSQLMAMFETEDACRNFLVKHRWPDGVECSRCGNKKIYTLKHKPYHWQCHQCAKKDRFSVIQWDDLREYKVSLEDLVSGRFHDAPLEERHERSSNQAHGLPR
jgi:hypothetical protein